MTELPPPLLESLRTYGQSHVLHGWQALSDQERITLADQLRAIDFDLLRTLYTRKNEPAAALPSRERITPLPVVSPSSIPAATTARGEEALRRNEVAVLVVAGGQGSRLGFEQPKGMFPVGPVSGSTLFRIHAEKVLALSRRYGNAIPFLVMTSPATHDDTVQYFASEQNFGMSAGQVHFFQQGTMPALDLATGRLLLEAPGRLFLSPNGHGGTLTALNDCGLLAKLTADGIKHLFYFQVDNPLVNVCDPAFLGRHIETNSEVSSKVVYKERPEEKVGVLAQIDGRCGIIEYSDMPEEMAAERAADGTLAFRAGNPAIHLFSLPFLDRVTSGRQRLAYHLARKKVPHYNPEAGVAVTPGEPNALKFELFVFDALPMADRWLAVEAKREDEFAPLKNASGADSIETCRAAMSAQTRRWLRAAGADVPDSVDVEISPTFALDKAEVKAKLRPGMVVASSLYLRTDD